MKRMSMANEGGYENAGTNSLFHSQWKHQKMLENKDYA